jgi:hypothetical protein
MHATGPFLVKQGLDRRIAALETEVGGDRPDFVILYWILDDDGIERAAQVAWLDDET